jgi:predicted kinase
MLIIFGGLPGTGKTSIAREVAKRLGAVYLRIDTIEQAMRESGNMTGAMDDAGYRAAYALTEENLRIGNTVVADSVNPLKITREHWRDVARRAKVAALEVEVICSDEGKHRRRVEVRVPDVAGLKLPTWEDVKNREYEPWVGGHLVVDTAKESVEEGVLKIERMIRMRCES